MPPQKPCLFDDTTAPSKTAWDRVFLSPDFSGVTLQP